MTLAVEYTNLVSSLPCYFRLNYDQFKKSSQKTRRASRFPLNNTI